VIVSYLPDPESHPLWNGIKELLEPAAKRAGIGARDYQELVWVAFEGALLFGAATTLLYDDGEAEIVLCGGRHGVKWIGLGEATVSAWARDCGAKKLTLGGRKGWARVLRAFGWVPTGTEDGKTLYEKDLTGGKES
jgi:hypothetical protein